MSDHTLTQIGLTCVYLGVGVVLVLTERVERSKALRIWSLTFFFFALNALMSALGGLYGRPDAVRPVAWIALTGAGVSGLAGTVAFIGRPLPRGLFALGAAGILSATLGDLLGLDPDLSRTAVFVCMGVLLLWSGRLIFVSGSLGGIGRWVMTSAFLGAALYAFVWPLLYETRWFARLEFFLDLTVVMWGAAGALLIHFERSRERIHDMAAKELELRAQLERSERMDALGRLAGGVAHDFNNVLTTVIHGSELALRQLDEPAKAAERIQLVLESARGAVAFTRQLLALGRRRLPGRMPIHVNEALHVALSMVRPSLRSSHTLVCPAVGEELAILAGEGQLEQVLVNLSINALDAMPNGGTLEVLVERRESMVEIAVRDAGCGMSEDTINRVFEPFFGTKSDKGGSGLGLTAVYAIVKQLDGQIDVTSAPGVGSCFTVRFPRCVAPAAIVVQSPRSSRPPSSVQILIVDDQDAVLSSLSASLEQTGYRVTTASCVEDALRVFEHTPPTLLLTDVHMPGRNGIDLVAKVRQAYPDLPVVMMTGYASDDVDSSRFGASWLFKPFTPEKLQAAIESALQH